MKKVSSKLTSKFQLTLPKTIRNYLNIDGFDIVDFIIKESGNVYIEKGKPREQCPICNDGIFYSEPCKICNGEGFLDKLTKESLITTLITTALTTNERIDLDLFEGIYNIRLDTNNELIKLYRDKIQLELIKYAITEGNSNEISSYQLKKYEEILQFQNTKKELKHWYEDECR